MKHTLYIYETLNQFIQSILQIKMYSYFFKYNDNKYNYNECSKNSIYCPL